MPFTSTLSLLLLLLAIVPSSIGAPVPIPKELDNTLEEEDGLLVLVPTVPVDKGGNPTKREIDYELISIPGDLIRRTVREVTESHGVKGGPLPSESYGGGGGASGSIFISDLNSGDNDEYIVNSNSAQSTLGSLLGTSNSKLNAISTTDLSKILSSVASAGFSAASTGANIAGQARNVISKATRAGTNAVVGGTQAVRWALQQKTSGLRSFAEFAGTGLQYAGRLTSAVLKVLLRVPGIKAKVLSDLIQAGQPFATALSDVIAESADDFGDIFAAQSDIFKDAIGVIFRLIQDVLSLKGRVLASFSAGGLDKGANLISSGVKVGSAFVQTAGDVVSAVGRGVGEIVKVASDVDLPAPPPLPTIKFPTLPTISYPKETYDSPSNSYLSPSSNSYKAPSDSYSAQGFLTDSFESS